MKVILKYKWVFVLLAFVWLFVFSGSHPQFHNFDDVKEIVITIHARNESGWPKETFKDVERSDQYSSVYSLTLTDQDEIQELADVIGITWDGIIPLHSYDSGTTTYRILIIKNSGERNSLLFTELEWGGSGSPPKRIIEHVRKIMG